MRLDRPSCFPSAAGLACGWSCAASPRPILDASVGVPSTDCLSHKARLHPSCCQNFSGQTIEARRETALEEADAWRSFAMDCRLNCLESDIRELCQARNLHAWLQSDSGKFLVCLLLIVSGGGLYGMSLGVWRSPLQALFVAIKFPLLLLLTALGTALINGMLAQLLNAPMNFRQSLLAVLMSFALLAVLLASFTPLIGFLLWHLPRMASSGQADAHRIFLLANVSVIAFAGTLANIQLHRLLKQTCGASAARILLVWLGMNLFLGAQLSWNLRPFFSTPSLPVTFLRPDPFDGSFYEAVFKLAKRSL